MARYLIGNSNDTWNFYQAYYACSPGDILELKENFHLILEDGFFEIDKDLTLEGHVNFEDNTNYYTNKIVGRLNIKNKANVNINSLWLESNNKFDNILNIKDSSTAFLNKVIIDRTDLIKLDSSQEKYPEVYVDDKNYLEGRIDRIDKCNNLLRIIDYKTGSKEIKIYNLLNGLDLQLFVYMLAAKEKKSENLFPVASFYFPLKDEVKKLEKNYDKDEIEKIYDDKTKMNGLIIKIDEEILNLLDKNFDGKKSDIFKITRSKDNIFSLEEEKIVEKFIKKLISSYISEIKNGNIKLNPLRINQNSYECINCHYKSICKFDYTRDQDKFHDINKNISINDIKKELSDE